MAIFVSRADRALQEQAAVERITSEPPSEADVERVRAHLRASGWDLA
jgi:hypothetical protein